AIDLNRPDVVSSADAIDRIRAAARHPRGEWTIATGWTNGRYGLAKTDFDDLPPVVVLSLSIHGLIVNDAARVLMRRYDATVVDHLDDQDWIERNLRRVLNVFANAGATPARIKTFFDWLLHEHGVYQVDEMLLVGAHEIDMCDEAGVADRIRFWS